MADNFPDISSKLSAPSKKSVFERQKAEAEAKRAKAEAETAAVYEDFVKSFDDDGEHVSTREDRLNRLASIAGFSGPGQGSGGSSVAGPGKRHFTSTGLKSGPGTLGPPPSGPRSGPGSLGPPTQGFGRKRPFDDFQPGRKEKERNHGMFSYDDDRPAFPPRDSADAVSAFRADDDDDDHKSSTEAKVAAKPTLHLSFLPPGTSPAVIKALIPPLLTVENVRIIPPAAPSGPNSTSTERKSTSAIVTLAAETPATDIDTAVSQLQNRYLGIGFNLSISRHLSSAALSGPSALLTPSSLSSSNNLPFGARPTPTQHTSLSRAPPPGHGQSRFAPPPTSYISSTPYSSRSTNTLSTQILVQPPTDLAQLKLIHKTLEALLTHGPEFEALLMSRPAIQSDPKWAWLFNARSPGGVYYRWRLWDILTDGSNRRQRRRPGYPGVSGSQGEEVFANSAPWIPPEAGTTLKFEYTTKMEEFIEDPDYDSSDEEEDGHRNAGNKDGNRGGGGLAGRYNDHNNLPTASLEGLGLGADTGIDGIGYLNPLAKAKLIHLLARLPENNAKLRKGDVARVTAFAIEHAGSGANEVVEICCANVVRPICCSGANRARNGRSRGGSGDGSEDDDTQGKVTDDKDNSGRKNTGEVKDTTPSSLVALYIISDILSSSSTSGVRHAWRYRSLFEQALKKQKVFETLGSVDRVLGWGRLKAEKWKRSVQSVLSLWEGWCVFPQTSHEGFVEGFLEPPQVKVAGEEEEARKKREREEEESRRAKSSNKWKSVEDGGGDVKMEKETGVDEEMEEADLDGEVMVDDDDDEDLEMSDIDGAPMDDSSDEDVVREHVPSGSEAATAPDESMKEKAVAEPVPEQPREQPPSAIKRQRPRAVDMFADDSGGE